jgi:hypothetical protein
VATDPGSLLLLDDENGWETVEDLSRPPGEWGLKGDGDKLLAVQAAGAEMDVLKVKRKGGKKEGGRHTARAAPIAPPLPHTVLTQIHLSPPPPLPPHKHTAAGPGWQCGGRGGAGGVAGEAG